MKSISYLSVLTVFVLSFLFAQPALAQSKEESRISNATDVLNDFVSMKEGIPHELLEMSEGIIIVPKMINAGLVIGGKRGRGIAMARTENGQWSKPIFVTITGGSVGFQIGAQAVDLVLVFKSRKSIEDAGIGTFTLGGDVSATAGPLGRSASASTDYKFDAEVYSYSRSKGLFAGISLAGSSINPDKKSNISFYDTAKPTDALDEDTADDPYSTKLMDLMNSISD